MATFSHPKYQPPGITVWRTCCPLPTLAQNPELARCGPDHCQAAVWWWHSLTGGMIPRPFQSHWTHSQHQQRLLLLPRRCCHHISNRIWFVILGMQEIYTWYTLANVCNWMFWDTTWQFFVSFHCRQRHNRNRIKTVHGAYSPMCKQYLGDDARNS